MNRMKDLQQIQGFRGMFWTLPCLAISSTDPVQYSWRLQEYTRGKPDSCWISIQERKWTLCTFGYGICSYNVVPMG